MSENLSTAIIFPGQGSQALHMADSWAEHPAGKAVLDEASESIGRDIVSGCQDDEQLRTTRFAQPALLACEIAALRVTEEEVDVSWFATAGHSLGQFASLVAAEVITFDQALTAVKARGEAMQRAGEERPGTMMALLGEIDEESAEDLCAQAADGGELVVANLNAPGQVVISGTVASIERAASLVADNRRIKARRLDVAGAFHSKLMRPAVARIVEALDGIEFRAPCFPIADNVTGDLVDDPAVLHSNLERHVVSPVRWEASIRTLGRAGVRTFVEAGPGNVLTGLVKKIARGEPALSDVQCISIDTPEAARNIVA